MERVTTKFKELRQRSTPSIVTNKNDYNEFKNISSGQELTQKILDQLKDVSDVKTRITHLSQIYLVLMSQSDTDGFKIEHDNALKEAVSALFEGDNNAISELQQQLTLDSKIIDLRVIFVIKILIILVKDKQNGVQELFSSLKPYGIIQKKFVLLFIMIAKEYGLFFYHDQYITTNMLSIIHQEVSSKSWDGSAGNDLLENILCAKIAIAMALFVFSRIEISESNQQLVKFILSHPLQKFENGIICSIGIGGGLLLNLASGSNFGEKDWSLITTSNINWRIALGLALVVESNLCEDVRVSYIQKNLQKIGRFIQEFCGTKNSFNQACIALIKEIFSRKYLSEYLDFGRKMLDKCLVNNVKDSNQKLLNLVKEIFSGIGDHYPYYQTFDQAKIVPVLFDKFKEIYLANISNNNDQTLVIFHLAQAIFSGNGIKNVSFARTVLVEFMNDLQSKSDKYNWNQTLFSFVKFLLNIVNGQNAIINELIFLVFRMMDSSAKESYITGLTDFIKYVRKNSEPFIFALLLNRILEYRESCKLRDYDNSIYNLMNLNAIKMFDLAKDDSRARILGILNQKSYFNYLNLMQYLVDYSSSSMMDDEVIWHSTVFLPGMAESLTKEQQRPHNYIPLFNNILKFMHEEYTQPVPKLRVLAFYSHIIKILIDNQYLYDVFINYVFVGSISQSGSSRKELVYKFLKINSSSSRGLPELTAFYNIVVMNNLPQNPAETLNLLSFYDRLHTYYYNGIYTKIDNIFGVVDARNILNQTLATIDNPEDKRQFMLDAIGRIKHFTYLKVYIFLLKSNDVDWGESLQFTKIFVNYDQIKPILFDLIKELSVSRNEMLCSLIEKNPRMFSVEYFTESISLQIGVICAKITQSNKSIDANELLEYILNSAFCSCWGSEALLFIGIIWDVMEQRLTKDGFYRKLLFDTFELEKIKRKLDLFIAEKKLNMTQQQLDHKIDKMLSDKYD